MVGGFEISQIKIHKWTTFTTFFAWLLTIFDQPLLNCFNETNYDKQSQVFLIKILILFSGTKRQSILLQIHSHKIE